MAILRVRDENGNIIEIPAIKGEKGDKGDPGDAASVDVQLNGTSIVQDGVANIPVATNQLGLVRNYSNEYASGIKFDPNGAIRLINLDTQIDNRTSNFAITNIYLDHAVKAALTDGKGEAYTSDEKASARNRFGLEWHLIDTMEVVDVAQVQIDFPQEYSEFMIIADISGNGSLVMHPYTCYYVNDNGTLQGRQMLHSAYYPGEKDEHLELIFEKANIDGDVYFNISGYEKTDYNWALNKNIQTTGWQQWYDVNITKPCHSWYFVKFVRTITSATFKIYGR